MAKTCSDRVAGAADGAIETIRLMLRPDRDDVELVDNGTLDTVLRLGDITETYSHEFAADYRSESGELDLEGMLDDVWDGLAERAYDAFSEYGLAFEYVSDADEHYFRYLISTGGPGTEIRFFVNYDLSLYRAEFWLLDWYDGASVNVTSDATIVALWEQYQETGTAAELRARDSAH